MSAPFDRRINDNPSTYMVQDRKNKKELTRLMVQDQMITAKMGGVLPEQVNSTVFHHVLDVACGTGGWIIKAAQTYPEMSLVGVDISERIIKHAQTQAAAHQVSDRVKFRVMDVLYPLSFPDASFDLVNLRLGVSFMRTWDWPKFLTELLRVTCPGGVIRLTEGDASPRSDSPAVAQLLDMSQCALYRAGHLFEQESPGLSAYLERLLDQYGCEHVQTKSYALEYHAGTPEGEAFCEDVTLVFQTIRPFIQKWNCASQDYDAIYRQALKEMELPDFHATWHMLTAWGSKPGPRS